ncbi:MAG: polysaccharide pyruvyl transferase family protein [Acidobacteria bacterium]|nr:polysaccharide pyruvyl transferase family protein [Acidobacteriota bacterium]
MIGEICRAELALDGAFYFDYSPYRIRGGGGKGVLQTYRTDSERVPAAIPRDNIDISITCSTLDEWLWTIARHELVRSDRAHVVIAAALLGKDVRYRPSN